MRGACDEAEGLRYEEGGPRHVLTFGMRVSCKFHTALKALLYNNLPSQMSQQRDAELHYLKVHTLRSTHSN